MAYNLTVQDGLDPTHPRDINWPLRQGRAFVKFEVHDGIPVNPRERDLPPGRNKLWHWGPATTVDPVVTAVDAAGTRSLLMIERRDGLGFALPGGFLDPNEDPEDALARELREETGLELLPSAFTLHDPRYVADPRAGLNAWVETLPGTAVLHTDTLPAVRGRDDAVRADWLPADSFELLTFSANLCFHQRIFPAHTAMLRDFLN